MAQASKQSEFVGKMQEKRNISAHNLPMAFQSVPARSALPRPAAAFLAQLLSGSQSSSLIGKPLNAQDMQVNGTYRRVEASDIKRIPQGYRKSVSA